MGHFLGCDIKSLGRTVLMAERANPIPAGCLSIDEKTGEVIGTGTQNSKRGKVCQWYYLFTFSKRKVLSFFNFRENDTQDLYPIDVYTNSSINSEMHWVVFVDESGYAEHFTINQLLEKSWEADPKSYMFRAVLRMIMSVNGLRIDPSGRRNQKPS
jgi:hypothetical protein